MSNIVFLAAEPVQIVGFDRECDCSHCGRPLKVGVKLAGFPGAFGADCLAKSFACYVYNGRRYRYGANEIKQRAIVVAKGEQRMREHGYNERHLRFVLKSALQSI